MKRYASVLALCAVLIVTTTGASGCRRKLIEVQTGSQVVCTYGEIVSSDIRTAKVAAKDAAKYSVTVSRVTCPRHQKLARLYAEAQLAIAKGDVKTARKKLAEVVAVEPVYRKAKDQIKAIDSGDKPEPDLAADPGGAIVGDGTGEGTPTTEGGNPKEPPPAGPVVNLLRYTPDSIPGYSAQAVIADPLSLSRTYLPVGSGDIRQLVIAAEQFRDAGHAQSVVVSRYQRAYPSATAAVTIAGKPGYFGTDSRTFAILAVRDGAVVVVFEMMSWSGKPDALKDDLVSVATVVF